MRIIKGLMVGLIIVSFAAPAFGEETQPIKLPEPQIKAGKPLMQALSERQSMRSFSSEDLTPQVLSNLLWAANGVNRPDGKRTVPSAKNSQEIDVYVAKKDGLYLYNAKGHELVPIFGGDIRSKAGKQNFVKEAPLVLIYVADFEKLGGGANAEIYGATDTGFISQNVYLYCASEGLATVVLGWVNKETLGEVMNLRAGQKVILTQPVGYPKK